MLYFFGSWYAWSWVYCSQLAREDWAMTGAHTLTLSCPLHLVLNNCTLSCALLLAVILKLEWLHSFLPCGRLLFQCGMLQLLLLMVPHPLPFSSVAYGYSLSLFPTLMSLVLRLSPSPFPSPLHVPSFEPSFFVGKKNNTHQIKTTYRFCVIMEYTHAFKSSIMRFLLICFYCLPLLNCSMIWHCFLEMIWKFKWWWSKCNYQNVWFLFIFCYAPYCLL